MTSSRPAGPWSTLGRPLDPSWPTNRAILIVMPTVGVLATVLALAQGSAVLGAGVQGLVTAATALGGWALARELAPDDQAAAFVAMALGLAAQAMVPVASLWLLFTTLLQVRLVNRTVGPPAWRKDSAAVLALTLACMVVLKAPTVAVVGGLAFGLDARLTPPGPTRHRVLAVTCIAVAAVYAAAVPVAHPHLDLPGTAIGGGLVVVALLFLWALLRTSEVRAVTDATGNPLHTARVRAGMTVALVAAAPSLIPGSPDPREASLLWAVLAGVGVSALRRRQPRRTARR